MFAAVLRGADPASLQNAVQSLSMASESSWSSRAPHAGSPVGKLTETMPGVIAISAGNERMFRAKTSCLNVQTRWRQMKERTTSLLFMHDTPAHF